MRRAFLLFALAASLAGCSSPPDEVARRSFGGAYGGLTGGYGRTPPD